MSVFIVHVKKDPDLHSEHSTCIAHIGCIFELLGDLTAELLTEVLNGLDNVITCAIHYSETWLNPIALGLKDKFGVETVSI